MNHLPPVGSGRWRLPRHAHLVIYEREEGGLLTIYDCGAAQKPPSAQLLGTLERVGVEAETHETPTGSVVSLRESAVLEEVAVDRYRIVREDSQHRVTEPLG